MQQGNEAVSEQKSPFLLGNLKKQGLETETKTEGTVFHKLARKDLDGIDGICARMEFDRKEQRTQRRPRNITKTPTADEQGRHGSTRILKPGGP